MVMWVGGELESPSKKTNKAHKTTKKYIKPIKPTKNHKAKNTNKKS